MSIDIVSAMRAFAAVVEANSFAAAADRLELSRGMTSRYVAQLETHLGTRLLNRTTRKLSLTEAGRDYYERATQILAMVAEAEHAASAGTAAPHGTLRVSTPVAFGARHLGPAMRGYLERYPKVTIELAANDRLVDLVDEGFDLAVRIARRVAPGLVARPLAKARLVACASPDYVARRGLPRTPADLSEHDCLTYAYTTPRVWRFARRGKTHEVKISGPLHANNGTMLAAAAASGCGICMEPAFIVDEFLDNGTLVRVLPGWDTDLFTVYAVFPARHLLPAKTRTFVDWLAEYFRSHATWDESRQK